MPGWHWNESRQCVIALQADMVCHSIAVIYPAIRHTSSIKPVFLWAYFSALSGAAVVSKTMHAYGKSFQFPLEKNDA